MIKIKLHSITDLITNSSTVIFTYSGGTIKPLKAMIDEIAKVLGSSKTCDEMFDAIILCDDADTYSKWMGERREDGEEYPDGVDENTDIVALWNDVRIGKVAKPKWFEEVENSEDYNGYNPSTYLYLIVKSTEYIEMGELIKGFLYSIDNEATEG